MSSESEIEKTIEKLADVMRRWYWSKKDDIDRHEVVKPAVDVLEYVHKARKEGLDKRSETAYCGSLLLYSVLSLTGRRHTSDVREANELYEVGRSLALALWNELDRAKNGSKESSELNSIYIEFVGKVTNALWKEYRKVKEGKFEHKKAEGEKSNEG